MSVIFIFPLGYQTWKLFMFLHTLAQYVTLKVVMMIIINYKKEN